MASAGGLGWPDEAAAGSDSAPGLGWPMNGAPVTPSSGLGHLPVDDTAHANGIGGIWDGAGDGTLASRETW